MTKGEEIVGAWVQACTKHARHANSYEAERDLMRRIDEALVEAVTEIGHRWVSACEQWHNATRERDQLTARLALAERVVEAARYALRYCEPCAGIGELSIDNPCDACAPVRAALAEWGKG